MGPLIKLKSLSRFWGSGKTTWYAIDSAGLTTTETSSFSENSGGRASNNFINTENWLVDVSSCKLTHT